MQGHQNPNQTKNMNGVLGLLNFWLSQPIKPKKKQVGLVDGFAKLLNGTLGLLNFWFEWLDWLVK